MATLRIRFDTKNSTAKFGDGWSAIYTCLGKMVYTHNLEQEGDIMVIDIPDGTDADIRKLSNAGFNVVKDPVQPD